MGISQISPSQFTYELIKKDLDVSSLRSKVIANNIANVSTKGYKAYKVSFEDSLKESMANIEDVHLKTTNERHIGDGSNDEFGTAKIERDNTSSMREDGNSVDPDVEMENQVANSYIYRTLITSAGNRLSNEKYVIDGSK